MSVYAHRMDESPVLRGNSRRIGNTGGSSGRRGIRAASPCVAHFSHVRNVNDAQLKGAFRFMHHLSQGEQSYDNPNNG